MDLDELIAKLPLVDADIAAEAAGQPMLYIEASRYRVEIMRKRSKAEASLDYARSQVSIRIRAKRQATGDKTTEASLKEHVECHPVIRQRRKLLDSYQAQEEFAKLLLDAYRQRRDAIRVTAEMQIAEGMHQDRELRYISERQQLRDTARKLQKR